MHFLLLEQPHSKEAVTNEQVSYVDDSRGLAVVEMDYTVVLVAILILSFDWSWLCPCCNGSLLGVVTRFRGRVRRDYFA